MGLVSGGASLQLLVSAAILNTILLLNQSMLVWDRLGLGDDHCKVVVAGLLVKINRVPEGTVGGTV
jgi:hypothetical protein